MTEPNTRTLRLCDVCGGLDDHPRDVTFVQPGEGTTPPPEWFDSLPPDTPARAIAEVMDPTSQIRHIDCCASKGCGTCQRILAEAQNAYGPELTSTIESGVVNHLGSPSAPAQEEAV